MAINVLEYSKIFQEELDKQMVAGSTSGWMEPNAQYIKYNGGDEVKVPVMSTDGLADYDRDDGFVEGSVSLKYKTLTMTQDRGRTFQLDAMDVNETNFVLSAGNVLGEFQSVHVIPEVDAYRYSRIAAYGINDGQVTSGYAPAAATVLEKLRDDLYSIWDEVGDGVDLVISISTQVAKILDNSSELQKQLGVTEFKKGEINLVVKTIDDVPLIKVPSSRMYTQFLFKDGSGDQKEGGFAPAAGAKAINWLITGRKTPMAISKTDTVRIFDPMTTQKAHAWKIDYRKYHDLWILPNKIKGIWVNTK